MGGWGVRREVGGWLGEPAGGTGGTLRPVVLCLVIKKLNKNSLSEPSQRIILSNLNMAASICFAFVIHENWPSATGVTDACPTRYRPTPLFVGRYRHTL